MLTALDDAKVCVRTTVKPLGRDVMLLRPEDLVIRDHVTPARYQDDAVHSCDGNLEMPARRGGAPVAMRISVEMHFTVR